MLFTTLLSVFAIAHSALAGVYITNPVGSTKQQGGQVITVTWGTFIPLSPVFDHAKGPCLVHAHPSALL